MKSTSCKVLKSLAVLLLSLEFLTPSILTDLFIFQPSDRNQPSLTVSTQKSSVVFLAEDTESEENQWKDEHQKVHLFIKQEIEITPRTRCSAAGRAIPIPFPTGEHFDLRPPLFTLHCRLLV